MDLASLIGFLGAVGMILGAMISGGGVGPFIDVASILIVFGGTFFRCDVHNTASDLPRQLWRYGKSVSCRQSKSKTQ